MAIRTISNAGGNWSATTAWVEGIVPVAADTVVATATSGNITLNNNVTIQAIDLTGYNGIFSFVSYTLNLIPTSVPANGCVVRFSTTMSTTANASLSYPTIQFTSTLPDILNIDFAGRDLSWLSITGKYKFISNFSMGATRYLEFKSGFLDMDGVTQTGGGFKLSTAAVKELSLGNATFNFTYPYSFYTSDGPNPIFNPNSATINLMQPANGCMFGSSSGSCTAATPMDFNGASMVVSCLATTINVYRSITIKNFYWRPTIAQTLQLNDLSTITFTGEVFIGSPEFIATIGYLYGLGSTLAFTNSSNSFFNCLFNKISVSGDFAINDTYSISAGGTFVAKARVNYVNIYDGVDSVSAPLGWKKLSYTAATGSIPHIGDFLTGAISGSTCRIMGFVDPYSWRVGEGILYIDYYATPFVAEAVSCSNGASFTISSDATNAAWKTLGAAILYPLIKPNDEFRICKTPSPVSIGQASWTDLSKTVTLETAQTQLVTNCESIWTAANGATVSAIAVATDAKEGASCLKIAIDSTPAINQLQAYLGFSSLNLSAFQRLTFWFKPSAVYVPFTWSVCLCSDSAGTVIVDQFLIDYPFGASATWTPLSLAKVSGGNLGNSIQSIAIYSGSVLPVASSNILIDNINASKSGGLDLLTPISKDGNPVAGVEGFHSIQSINGVTLLLDCYATTKANQGRGYSGVTETIESFMRFPFAVPTTGGYSGTTAGTSLSLLTKYLFGYNMFTSLADGETILDGSYGNSLFALQRNFIEVSRISVLRSVYGIVRYGQQFCKISFGTLTNCQYGLGQSSSVTGNCEFTGNVIQNCLVQNLSVDVSSCSTYRIKEVKNGLGAGLYMDNVAWTIGNKCYVDVIRNNFTAGNFGGHQNILFNSVITNNTNGLMFSTGDNYMVNVSIDNSVEVQANAYGFIPYRLYSHNHDKVVGNHKIYEAYATMSFIPGGGFVDTVGRWQVDIAYSMRNIDHPVIMLGYIQLYCLAGIPKTISCMVKLTHATDIGASLRILPFESEGIQSKIVVTAAETTSWQVISISFTPTANGVVSIDAQSYWIANAADESVYFSKPFIIT